jgi:monofunctional glycosyltransferase
MFVLMTALKKSALFLLSEYFLLNPVKCLQVSKDGDANGLSTNQAKASGLSWLPFKIKQRYRSLSPAKRKFVISIMIVVIAVLVIPPLQVGYVRFFNPSTTAPILLQNFQAKISGSPPVSKNIIWQPLEKIPSDFILCVWKTEDARFFVHHGIDWKSIKWALDEAKATGRPARGASTITQQCARSLFLWQGRSWTRKGLEAYYTIWMELLLSKKRILELYANVIELGDHVYGVEAASYHHFGIPASALSRERIALLVAIMPNPRKMNPNNPSALVVDRQEAILKRTESAMLPLDF